MSDKKSTLRTWEVGAPERRQGPRTVPNRAAAWIAVPHPAAGQWAG